MGRIKRIAYSGWVLDKRFIASEGGWKGETRMIAIELMIGWIQRSLILMDDYDLNKNVRFIKEGGFVNWGESCSGYDDV